MSGLDVRLSQREKTILTAVSSVRMLQNKEENIGSVRICRFESYDRKYVTQRWKII